MLKFTRQSMSLAFLAWLGGLAPTQVRGESEVSSVADTSPRAVDVRLSESGQLRGNVFDAATHPLAGVRVSLQQGNDTRATATTDSAGQFAVTVHQGGLYQLAVGPARYEIRCWKPAAAPPHALEQVWLTDATTVRGQVQPSCWGIANPWVIAGVTAAAIAIPLVLASERDDRDISSE